MAIELTPNARKLLARRGFDPVLGARPLRRTIQREIEDQLSEKILFGEVEPGQIVIIDVEGFDPRTPRAPRRTRQVRLPGRAEAEGERAGHDPRRRRRGVDPEVPRVGRLSTPSRHNSTPTADRTIRSGSAVVVFGPTPGATRMQPRGS